MGPPDDPASADEGRMARIGAALETAGLMTQGDHVRLVRLSKDVVSSDGSISGADLDWALALLASATGQGLCPPFSLLLVGPASGFFPRRVAGPGHPAETTRRVGRPFGEPFSGRVSLEGPPFGPGSLPPTTTRPCRCGAGKEVPCPRS
jgi:hypothetical protein